MTQKLRLLVELEVPDTIDLDQLKEKVAELFPGRVRVPEDDDLVVFFRPDAEAGYTQWGTIAPEEVTMHCRKTAGQMARPVDADEVYYNAMGEVFGVAGALYEKNNS